MYATRRRHSACVGSTVLAFLLLAVLPATGDLNLGPEELVYTDPGAIEVPGWSIPSFAYWDGDNLKDLVVGEGGMADPGMVRVYLNIGTPSSPQFSGYFYAQSNGLPLVVPSSG